MNIFDLHADICKALAHPDRLRIIEALSGTELAAGEIALRLGAPKANVSRHLAVMRAKGIVEPRRQGLNIFYRLTSPKVTQACQLMREVLMEQMEQQQAALQASGS